MRTQWNALETSQTPASHGNMEVQASLATQVAAHTVVLTCTGASHQWPVTGGLQSFTALYLRDPQQAPPQLSLPGSCLSLTLSFTWGLRCTQRLYSGHPTHPSSATWQHGSADSLVTQAAAHMVFLSVTCCCGLLWRDWKSLQHDTSESPGGPSSAQPPS